MNILKKLTTKQAFWLIALCIVISLISIIVSFNFSYLISHISQVISWLTTSIAIFLWFEKVSITFAKTIAKAKATIFNKQVAISINVDYEGISINKYTFENIKENLLKLNKSHEIIENNDLLYRIRINGLNIDTEIYYKDCDSINCDVDTIGHINIYIPEYHAPYNESIKLLQSKILPTFTDIEDYSKPTTHNYTVEILFQNSGNPYLSVYTKKLGANLLDFCCEISDSTNDGSQKAKQLVTVLKDQMKFSANNINSMSSLIVDHLAL